MKVFFCDAYLAAGDLCDFSGGIPALEALRLPLVVGVDLSLYCVVLGMAKRRLTYEITLEALGDGTRRLLDRILLPTPRYHASRFTYCINLRGVKITEACRLVATASSIPPRNGLLEQSSIEILAPAQGDAPTGRSSIAKPSEPNTSWGQQEVLGLTAIR